jgi:membrane associated rhomboid family serine protease
MRSRYPYRPAASDISYSFGPGPWTPVIKALIIANVVAFLAKWIAGDSFATNRLLGLSLNGVLHGYVWQIVTYLFLHAGVWHLTFNMLALWMFGVDLERGWGSRYFLKYYFVCGLGAAGTMLLVSLIPSFSYLAAIPTVGASGAIYGVLLAYGLYFPHRPILMFMFFPVPARYAVMIMGGIALISSFDGPGGTAHVAHLGGLVVGYLFLKGGRLHLMSEIQYRLTKWRVNRLKRRFDVLEGGRRANDVDRRVH